MSWRARAPAVTTNSNEFASLLRSIILYLVAGPHPRDLCLRALRRSALVATTVRLVRHSVVVQGLQACLFDISLFPRLPQFQPIERVFHQELARSLERIIFALGKALPVFRHQNA